MTTTTQEARDTLVFTPFPWHGPKNLDERDDRLQLPVSRDDAQRFYQACGSDTWITMTDQATGIRYAVRDWPCGLGCDCAAVARHLQTETVPTAALIGGDIITEVDTPDGPYYEVVRIAGRQLTVRSHGEEVTLPATPGAVVLRLAA